MSIEVRVSRMHRFNDNAKTLKAFADIEVNGVLLIKGLHVVQGKKSLFVSMPRQKGSDNKWYETVRALNPEVKSYIFSAVLSEYKNSGNGEL